MWDWRIFSSGRKNVFPCGGIDIALRWLIVARKRLEGSKTKVPLICCCAESLPFPNESFHWVVASATLEHTHETGKAITESQRYYRIQASFPEHSESL